MATAKKTTTKKKVSNEVEATTTTGNSKVSKTKTKKATAGTAKTKTAKATKTKATKKSKESAIPEVKEVASSIIPNAYGLEKFKEWTEQVEEVKCQAIKVRVKSTAGKHLHDFQIKLYLREIAEKEGYCLASLKMFDDCFEFILCKPLDLQTIEFDGEKK